MNSKPGCHLCGTCLHCNSNARTRCYPHPTGSGYPKPIVTGSLIAC